MRRSWSHDESSNLNGNRVDLPAPGGATRTHDERSSSARRTSSTTSSIGRSVRGTAGIRTGSGHGRGAVERHRIARGGDRRHRPRRGVGNRFGNGSPLHGVPTFGGRRHASVGSKEDEGGERRQAQTAHECPIGIGEHQEFFGHRPEKGAGFVVGCCDHEIHANSRAGETAQNPSGGLEDPRTLIGERVEYDRGQMERGQPFGQRTGFGADRIEGGGGVGGRNHVTKGSAP